MKLALWVVRVASARTEARASREDVFQVADLWPEKVQTKAHLSSRVYAPSTYVALYVFISPAHTHRRERDAFLLFRLLLKTAAPSHAVRSTLPLTYITEVAGAKNTWKSSLSYAKSTYSELCTQKALLRKANGANYSHRFIFYSHNPFLIT